MEQSTKATLESKDIDLQHSSPSLSPQDNELVARADEQLAHAYEQIASADEQLARLHTTVLRFEQEDARHELRSARDRPALRGMIGLLLTGCIFVAAFVAQSSYGDAARLMILQWYPQFGSAPSLPQENPELAQTNASAVKIVGTGAAVRQAPLAQMLQSLSQSTEQLKTSQEQDARDIARLSEQLKAAQAQIARDNANAAEQLRLLQERMARLTTAPSEQNVRPKASAPPTPIVAPKPKPLPALSSPQARAQPRAPTELRAGQQ